MDSIIDFHTHTYTSGYADTIPIQTALSIPLGMPSTYTWSDLMVVAGMNGKPDLYRNFLQTELPTINEHWYRQVGHWNTASKGKRSQCQFIFVPWISLLTDLRAIRKAEWFTTSNIIKFIPVLDAIPEAHDEPNSPEYMTRCFEDAYLPTLHRIVHDLPQKVIMIHTGWGSAPVLYHHLIANFPDKIFVLAHLKEDDDSDNVERQSIMNECDNCYLEMSYLSSPKRLSQYVNGDEKRKGYGDRILFGSDYRSPADYCTLQWMIDAIKLAPISDTARRRILYDNAAELLQQIKKD